MWPFSETRRDPFEEQAVEECQRAEWIDVRRRGASRFAWREHVLPVGLPIGLALGALNALAGGMHGGEAVPALVAEGWFFVATAMALAHLSAALTWQHRERVHRERYGRRAGPR
jgi:hypothetical protein